MNKKGIFIAFYAVLFVLLVLYAIFTLASSDNNLNRSKSIGYLQNDVYYLYSNADSKEFYLNIKLDYALSKAIRDFTEFDWFYDGNIDANVFNRDLSNEFVSLILNNLNEQGLDVIITDNKIKLEATDSYNVKNEKYSLNYHQKILLERDLKFNLDRLIEFKKELVNKYSCLKESQDNEAMKCLDNKGLTIEVKKEGNLIEFKIIGDEEIYTLENNNLKKVRPVFTFTLDLNKASTF